MTLYMSEDLDVLILDKDLMDYIADNETVVTGLAYTKDASLRSLVLAKFTLEYLLNKDFRKIHNYGKGHELYLEVRELAALIGKIGAGNIKLDKVWDKIT